MNELALFAGAGGGILGAKLLGWRTVCAVEIEAYPREVLLRRQRDGLLPVFPIWDDITTFDGRPWCGLVDVVTAGFPCQPFSNAGKRGGEDDERNGWPWTARILSNGDSALSDAQCAGLEGHDDRRGAPVETEGQRTDARAIRVSAGRDWWATEPRLGRVAYGLAHRVERLVGIGNGQVPAVVVRAWEILSGSRMMGGSGQGDTT